MKWGFSWSDFERWIQSFDFVLFNSFQFVIFKRIWEQSILGKLERMFVFWPKLGHHTRTPLFNVLLMLSSQYSQMKVEQKQRKVRKNLLSHFSSYKTHCHMEPVLDDWLNEVHIISNSSYQNSKNVIKVLRNEVLNMVFKIISNSWTKNRFIFTGYFSILQI